MYDFWALDVFTDEDLKKLEELLKDPALAKTDPPPAPKNEDYMAGGGFEFL